MWKTLEDCEIYITLHSDYKLWLNYKNSEMFQGKLVKEVKKHIR